MKTEDMRFATKLPLTRIRQIVRGVLARAEIHPLHCEGRDEIPDLGIVATEDSVPFSRSSFGRGRGVVEICVTDRGDFREIELTALGTGMREHLMMGISGDVSGLVVLRKSCRMMEAVSAAIRRFHSVATA